MQELLLYSILGPFLLGGLCFILPKKVKYVREFISLVGTLAFAGLALWLFINKPLELDLFGMTLLKLDFLSGVILLVSGTVALLATVYSLKFMENSDYGKTFYGSLLWSVGGACGVILSNHLVLFLIFWGFLGLPLYLLILSKGSEAAGPARKALVMIGGSDALMVLAVALTYTSTGTMMIDGLKFLSNGSIPYTIFILFLIGVFAKIGVVPLHTWILDMAEKAPLPATAFLAGSLDKLLGVYFITRLCLNMFAMTGGMNLILLILGSITIMVSVIMGMLHHDPKRVLGYLVVAGAGYMILGYGTGNPIGIAGGLFYMICSALWTQCLLLCLGCVEHRAGTTDVSKLGGLCRFMPLTFVGALIGFLAISGIPPLNGFAAKWMIYQGLIELGSTGNQAWVIWLIAALFGSTLTLAISMKMLHAIFLGSPSTYVEAKKVQRSNGLMIIPVGVLALVSIVFGVFAHSLPLKELVLPIISNVSYAGFWQPGTATTFVLAGLIVGFLIYLMGNLKGIREADTFVGGEPYRPEERIDGAQFYDTIHNMGPIKSLYDRALKKRFDIYEQGHEWAFGISNLFRRLHTGVLTNYMFWLLLGLTVLLVIFMW